MNIEEKTLPRKIKGTTKGLEISGFRIVKYSIRSESGCTIVLRDQAYYVPGLPKYLRIISTQGIHTTDGKNGTLIAHCIDYHDGYAELNLKEDNPVWQKSEPVKRVFVNNYPKNKLPTHEYILPNQREKEVKALESAVRFT